MARYVDADKMIADTEAMRAVSEAITIDGIVKYLNEHATADVQEWTHCPCGAKMDEEKVE